ncbi:MAG TPA: uroporphyrinogen-III synthase, partial [Bacillales bacterium]|nr:uroporphyrinogen-III synthase [Bacillales bacterium]
EIDVLSEDGTTAGLMEKLNAVDLNGKKFVVQVLDGAGLDSITQLNESGAECFALSPYEYEPAGEEILSNLCSLIIEEKIDAAAFTSAGQVDSLFRYAERSGSTPKIVKAFNRKTLAAAVGKVTGDKLREEGVDRVVVPENQRMGAMVMALAKACME